MKAVPSLSKRPHPVFRWWAALMAAIVLLLASVAAGAVGHYVLNWF